MLSHDMTRYVELHRAVGFKFRDQRVMLRRFVAFAEAQGDEFVRVERALVWAEATPSPARRRQRLLSIRRFALAMQAEDGRHEVPAADAFGRVPYMRLIPHIYSPDEIARLIEAAAQMGPSGSFKPRMYATLLGLLAATGLRISEALALSLGDVTEEGLIIRQTKFHKSRFVPLHDTTQRALDSYLMVRTRLGTFEDSLFVSDSGKAPTGNTVRAVFLRLARSIGLRGSPVAKDLASTISDTPLPSVPSNNVGMIGRRSLDTSPL